MAPSTNETLRLLDTVGTDELQHGLRQVRYRGIFQADGSPVLPYAGAKFHLATVTPAAGEAMPPQLHLPGQHASHPLYTAQPTVYDNQLRTMATVEEMLVQHGKTVGSLRMEAVHYESVGRGEFHISPPIIERHVLRLRNGFIDLEHLAQRFAGYALRDERGQLHQLGQRYLHSYGIDEVSSIPHYDIFHPNLEIINYGSGMTGDWEFYVVCDGSHRLAYNLEELQRKTTAIVVEPAVPLLPYYALPRPFYPMMRLSSKQAERKYQRLDIDKLHLLSDFLRKYLHYNWDDTGLHISKLRTNQSKS